MILHHPPSSNRRHQLSIVPTKTDIILINILVASLYLLDKLALGTLGIAHERPITHIVSESGKEKGVLAIALKHLAEFAEVSAKQPVGLLACERTAIMLSWLDAMAIAYVWIVLGLMKPFEIFDGGHTALEG